MDKLEQKLMIYLKEARDKKGPSESRLCPPLDDFYRFVMDELTGADLESMLDYLKNHPEDQEWVRAARLMLAGSGEAETGVVPPGAVKRVQGLVKPRSGKSVACPHCGKAVTAFKKPVQRQIFWSAAWFCLAIASFGLSFVFPRFFLQFLVMTLLFGVKWLIDEKALRTQILIYKALNEDERASAHRHPDRLSQKI